MKPRLSGESDYHLREIHIRIGAAYLLIQQARRLLADASEDLYEAHRMGEHMLYDCGEGGGER